MFKKKLKNQSGNIYKNTWIENLNQCSCISNIAKLEILTSFQYFVYSPINPVIFDYLLLSDYGRYVYTNSATTRICFVREMET